jgi:hypothetical protein
MDVDKVSYNTFMRELMMNSQKGYVVNVVVTGLMAVVVLSTVLFVGRFFCLQNLWSLIPSETAMVLESPSGLLGDWDEPTDGQVSEPNAVAKSSAIWLGTNFGLMIGELGIFEVLLRDIDWEQFISPDVYAAWGERNEEMVGLVYFDRKLGLFVNCDIGREGIDDKGRWTKIINWYAGPGGISQKPDGTIGRFDRPVMYAGPGGISQKPDGTIGRFDRPVMAEGRLIIFEHGLSQFFQIDFKNKEVRSGPKVEHEIVQVGELTKNDIALRLYWSPPMRRTVKSRRRPSGEVKTSVRYEPVRTDMRTFGPRSWEPVLDKSGTIYKLNAETLELTGPIGELPWPGTRGLLAYDVTGFSIKGEHKGLIAAGLGPNIFRPGFLVFDADGNRIGEEWGDVELLKLAGGPGLSVVNYVVETLQPTIFQLASYFTALKFDGAGGPRSLFILPNSFVARIGSEWGAEGLAEHILGLWVIFPSVAISVLLAWRIEKDARNIGLGSRTKFWWMIATVAFGLSAYITYRLTRPKDTLVTCTNCGRMRRPDMDRCHQCGSKWEVPELVAPMWRVVEKG